MPIVVNDTLEFPTCPTILRPPIDAGECAAHPSFKELVTAEHVALKGCTIRSGVGWCIETVAEVATTCTV